MPINVVVATNVADDLGWTRWTWLPFLYSSVLDTERSIAYSPAPDNLTPGSKFQVASETITCSLVLSRVWFI